MEYFIVKVKDKVKDNIGSTGFDKLHDMAQSINMLILSAQLSNVAGSIKNEEIEGLVGKLKSEIDIPAIISAVKGKDLKKLIEIYFNELNFKDSPLPKEVMIMMGKHMAEESLEIAQSSDDTTIDDILSGIDK